MATIYRQLRTNLETRRNRPEASRFYRSEMNARLAAARSRGWSVERVVLWLYRTISMYGQSVLRPMVTFLVVSLLGAFAFSINGLDLDPDPNGSTSASRMATWTFAVQSMLSFFRPPVADLSTADLWVQIGLRFAGPALIALAVLGVRDKVAR